MSLPNYIGAVTGLPLSELQPFLFDCSPGGACSTDAASLFAQVASWKAYEESMTTNCQTTGFVGYAVRHNPPPYLTSLVGCASFDVPYTELQTDLDDDTLPVFSFVTPNTIDDMHDGPDPAAIQAGDSWLAGELPKILNSAAYQSGTTVVFITFDEGAGGTIGEDCAKNTTDESCHVLTIVISSYTRPGTSRSGCTTTTREREGVREHVLVAVCRRVEDAARLALADLRAAVINGSIPGASNHATGAWRRSHAQEACG